MKFTSLVVLLLSASSTSAFAPPQRAFHHVLTSLQMGEDSTKMTTFREAEVLGLRLMQEGQFEDALKAFKDGMKLDGSRSDVIRKALVSGPSPVGGASGGTDSTFVKLLDEFELQAAHYNMACAHAQIGSPQESVKNLQLAFENGFENFATVRGDEDLKPLSGMEEFEELMEQYDSQKGFNPFKLFSK